jgi:hypothetical protein
MERTITTAALVKHFGTDAYELKALRLLFNRQDNFPESDAAVALLDLRSRRKPTTPAPVGRQQSRGGALGELLRKLRGANRRVPQEARTDG